MGQGQGLGFTQLGSGGSRGAPWRRAARAAFARSCGDAEGGLPPSRSSSESSKSMTSAPTGGDRPFFGEGRKGEGVAMEDLGYNWPV